MMVSTTKYSLFLICLRLFLVFNVKERALSVSFLPVYSIGPLPVDVLSGDFTEETIEKLRM
jgi:hypothetical protein